MKKFYLLFLFAGILFFGALFVTNSAKAITISQLNLEIVARPGETIEQLVQLYDESFAGSTVYPVVYNFTESPTTEGSVLILSEPEDLKPDRTWVQWQTLESYGVATETDTEEDGDEEETSEADEDEDADEESDEEAVVAEWGQEEIPINLPVEGTLADFPYRIQVPQDAEPGTHLISLVFQLKPAEQTGTEGAAVYIGSNVATNIFLKVLGATIDDVDVEFKSGVFGKKGPDVSVEERKSSFVEKSFFMKPPVDFLVTVDNVGNTHQKPDGNIKIVNDLWGSRTEEIQVNEVNKIILPGTDRTFEVSSYGQGFMFGKYRAKITLLYGDPLKPVEKEIAFWIVPLVEILITLGSLTFLIIIIIIIRKLRKKKRLEKEKVKEDELRQKILDEVRGKRPEPAVKEQKKKNGQKKEKNIKNDKVRKGKDKT